MSANSDISAFETMISGLQKYKSSLQEHSGTLLQGVEIYDRGVNDRSSRVYKNKIGKLCKQIDPDVIEKIEKLENNLRQQLELLREMEQQLQNEENE